MDFINKSYENGDEALAKKDFETVFEFVQECNLTGDEFMIALNLVSSQELSNVQGERIKYFRDVNKANFNLYASAYVDYRNNSKPYEMGKNLIKEFLSPPPPEPTPEEKKASRLKFLKEQYSRMKNEKEIFGFNLLYPLVKKTSKNGTVRISFIEQVLNSFVPEKKSGQVSMDGKTETPKIIKKDITSHWEANFVKTYINFNKLNELSENDWVEHWEKLYELEL